MVAGVLRSVGALWHLGEVVWVAERAGEDSDKLTRAWRWRSISPLADMAGIFKIISLAFFPDVDIDVLPLFAAVLMDGDDANGAVIANQHSRFVLQG